LQRRQREQHAARRRELFVQRLPDQRVGELVARGVSALALADQPRGERLFEGVEQRRLVALGGGT
jgi:hypothetical protein